MSWMDSPRKRKKQGVSDLRSEVSLVWLFRFILKTKILTNSSNSNRFIPFIKIEKHHSELAIKSEILNGLTTHRDFAVEKMASTPD